MSQDILRIDNVQVELLYKDEEFLGLGTITIDGINIRSNTIPLRPLLLSVDGVAFGRFKLIEILEETHTKTLVIKSYGIPTGQSLYLDHLGIQTARFTGVDTPVLTLRWVFAPNERKIDNRTYRGLSWHYEVDGEEDVFFDMSEQGSWEINGSVEGNRLLYQGEHIAPEIDLAIETEIDTRWTIKDKTPCRNIHPLCAVPLRVSKNQPFDFITHRLGNLTTFFAPDMGYVGCIMKKEAGQTICPWQERYRFRETTKFRTPERYVLFSISERAVTRVQVRNEWTRVYDEVGNGLRKAHNIAHFRNPIGAGLCTWYAWVGDTKDEYIKKAGRHLELLAKTFMPLFSQMGFTSYYLHPVWKSTLPDQPHCAVDRFEPDQIIGGWKSLRMLNEEAEKVGVTIYPWVSMHLGEKSSIFKEHPEWKIKARDTYNYTPGFPADIAQVDLEGGYQDYLFEMLKTVRVRAGIKGLFFDTLCTHSLYNISWHRQSQTHVQAVANLLGRLSELGYDIGGETVTPYVKSMRGEECLHNDFHYKNVNKDNLNASRWANYKLGLLGPALGEELRTPFDWRTHYLHVANRHSPVICFTSGGTGMMQIDEAWAKKIERVWCKDATRVNQDYNAAEPFLYKRTLLEDETGVLWEDKTGKVRHLFCFKPMCYHVNAKKVTCLTTGKTIAEFPEIALEAYHTYRIDSC